jgi:hypothetical protein
MPDLPYLVYNRYSANRQGFQAVKDSISMAVKKIQKSGHIQPLVVCGLFAVLRSLLPYTVDKILLAGPAAP